MSLAPPPPVVTGPARRLMDDLRIERAAAAEVPFPPGEHRPSVRRTRRFRTDPLALLLESYERYGPVFTLRLFHSRSVFLLGPEANRAVTVTQADAFSWRHGHFGDLMPLLGDGLLTIDGPFHDHVRRIALPAFHRERIAAAAAVMAPEIDAALASWRDGVRLDLYAWTRPLALRIALRALFGLDPDGRLARESDAATSFEQALGFWAADYFLQVVRGPGSPWRRMLAARRRLDVLVLGEIARRRRTGERGSDVLSMLLDAADDDGVRLGDRHVRDQVMTLLFAGHDTTTSTVSFLFHELGRTPHELRRLLDERDAVLGGRPPAFEELMGGALPRLDLVLDETLRLYPAAWIGPRRSLRPFEVAGVRVPGGVPVNYCSWASHRLPDVWPEPDAFRPDRFAEPQRSRVPKGAYVPFGGGSRICLGMRFGQLEVKSIVTRILRDFTLELDDGFRLRVRQMPTIGPRGGLPVTVRAR